MRKRRRERLFYARRYFGEDITLRADTDGGTGRGSNQGREQEPCTPCPLLHVFTLWRSTKGVTPGTDSGTFLLHQGEDNGYIHGYTLHKPLRDKELQRDNGYGIQCNSEVFLQTVPEVLPVLP